MFTDIDKQMMHHAIEACRRGIESGQSPFGSAIARGDELIVATHNHVWANTDITAHAEVHNIRLACEQLEAVELHGCTIYATTEPCPMCFSAIHWAKIERIIFGSSIEDAQSAGFSELTISNEQMKNDGGSPLEIVGPLLRDECVALFDEWKSRPDRRVY